LHALRRVGEGARHVGVCTGGAGVGAFTTEWAEGTIEGFRWS